MPAQLQLFEARNASDSWSVRVSRRARRLSVRVYPGGRVEVVVPPGASAANVHRFVHSHREWIAERVADLSSAAPQALDRRPNRIHLRGIGQSFDVAYRPAPTRTIEIRRQLTTNTIVLSGPVHSEEAVAGALRVWLADVARKELGLLLAEVAACGGFRFERLQARRQRTRWGSCSASGTISLNVCLLFLEPAVVRYLLVHELCHTRHMNHSARFWALVGQYEPDYKRLDRELLKGWQCVPGWVFG
jgi:predicted metal-dependent hydrolase